MGRFHFNNIRLRNKLLIIYIVSVFIPIILTNVIFYYVTTENVKSQKMHDLSLSLEQMSNEFSQGVDDAIGVSTVLYADNMLYSFLERQYTSLIDFILAYNSYFRDIDKYVPIYSSIHSITIYTDNETIIYAGGIHQINEQVKESHWYKNTDNLRGLFPVLTRTRGDSGQLNRFSLIRELNYFNNNTTQKIIKIELSPAMIEQTFNNVTFQGDVYLVNENGMIEYTTDPDVKWAEKSYQFDSISDRKSVV